MNNTIPTRTIWVTAVSEPSGYGWRVFIHPKTGEPESHFDMLTDARGFGALPQIDDELVMEGLVRSTEWELGSDHGFVAWVEKIPVDSSMLKFSSELVAPPALG
jgi:hypothetical protein